MSQKTTERQLWRSRFKVQVSSVRKFVDDARREDQLEALDAFADVLDEIRYDILEQARTNRLTYAAARRQKAPRSIHPFLRPLVQMLAERVFRLALYLESQAVGLRVRLKS